MTGEGDPQRAADPPVGSLAEEAAKLLGVLKEWANDHGGSVGQAVAQATGRAEEAPRDVEGHAATGAPECTVCPVCRTVHAVRGLNPEVRSHLSSAATSLGQAVSAFLSTEPPAPQGRRRDAGSPVDDGSRDEAGPLADT